jgi:hypothetical protein
MLELLMLKVRLSVFQMLITKEKLAKVVAVLLEHPESVQITYGKTIVNREGLSKGFKLSREKLKNES